MSPRAAPSFRTVEVSDPALAPEGLVFVTVKSAALGRRADLTLYRPPQAEGRRGVPLVLLLHGVYGSHWAWAFKGGAHHTAQRLIDSGAIPPLVLAMPSDGLWGDGSGYVRHADHDAERWIVDEVPAAAGAALPECDARAPVAIAGLSMGGFAALRLAGRYPQRFCAAAGLSSVTEASQLDAVIAEPRAGWAGGPADASVLQALRLAGGSLPPLRLDCGTDDHLLPANRALHTALGAAGIAHEYAEHPGGHDWGYWSRRLDDTLRFLGREIARRA
jgi:S-formylglutathione hydrolase FrmB